MAFSDDAQPHGRKRAQALPDDEGHPPCRNPTPGIGSQRRMPGQEPCGCDQNLVTSDAVMPTKRQREILPINRKTGYNCTAVQQHIQHAWQPTQSRYFLSQSSKYLQPLPCLRLLLCSQTFWRLERPAKSPSEIALRWLELSHTFWSFERPEKSSSGSALSWLLLSAKI